MLKLKAPSVKYMWLVRIETFILRRLRRSGSFWIVVMSGQVQTAFVFPKCAFIFSNEKDHYHISVKLKLKRPFISAIGTRPDKEIARVASTTMLRLRSGRCS